MRAGPPRLTRRRALALAAGLAVATPGLAAAPLGHAVRVLMETEAGPIVLELYPDRAPKTVANFLAYLDSGLWARASFYRSVTPANDHNPATISVIQGGLDTDVPPLPTIPLETTQATGLRHVKGAISMARGAPDSAGADFFICTADDPALDWGGARTADRQGFAAFGRVVEGWPAVQAIAAAALKSGGGDAYVAGQRLARPVRILGVFRGSPRR